MGSQATLGYGDFAADFAIDAIAILILAYAIYFRRHHRRDLLMAYVCFNVALFVVVKVMASGGSEAGLALGLGLFGALSIIRLRSEPLSYSEIAYFFSALALAIVNGVGLDDRLYTAMLNAAVLVAMFAMDHLEPHRKVERMSLVLDEVYADEVALRAELERRLGAYIVGVSINQIDYVREVMELDVQYVPGAAAAQPARLVPLEVRRAKVGQ